MELTPEDVEEILALLDSLPYDELDLQTPRFRLTLTRAPTGWTQSTHQSQPTRQSQATHQSTPTPSPTFHEMSGGGRESADGRDQEPTTWLSQPRGPDDMNVTSKGLDHEGGEPGGAGGAGDGGGSGDGVGVVVVRAPLPGTFYRAPRPGAEPFVEVGSRVDEETVVGIVETMKLFNPVHAGTRGQVTEICVGNAEFTPGGGALVCVRTDR